MVFIVNLTKPVILASGSPRRKELLALAGFNFTVCPAKGEEVTTKTLPCDIVCELAHQKAFEIAKAQKAPCYVIGADTIVAFENRILGKPKDSADAVRMVSMLQGNTHQVYTGVTLIEVCADGSLREKSFYEETNVHVCQMTKDEIASYVATGEPLDKAGAYGIQGTFSLKATILTLLAFLFLVFIMNLLLFKMQLTNKCSALLGKLRRYPYGYRLVYFGLIIFIYFLLRFVRMIIATTAAARIIPITTRIIPIIPLASSIPRIWLI